MTICFEDSGGRDCRDGRSLRRPCGSVDRQEILLAVGKSGKFDAEPRYR